MQKLELTKEQHNSLMKLIEVGLNEGDGKNEDMIKGKILEAHVREGWSNSPAQSLNGLSTDEMAKVLFQPNSYEIKKDMCKYQEYLVGFQINKHTTIENRVTKHNDIEMDKTEIVELAINNINRLNIDVNEEILIDVETVTIEYLN